MSSSSNDSPPPPKVLGLFGKMSLPPPPAGRGPLNKTTVGMGPQHEPPAAVTLPDVPSSVSALDDPLADFFDGSAQPVVIDQAPEPARPAPETIDTGPMPPMSVAKLGLAKTMIGGPAHEIMRAEIRRDPRADPDTSPPKEAAASRQDLQGVVFDPDQSVARYLGEAALDASVGATDTSDPFADTPLPQFPAALASEPAPPTLPVRSMRSALVIIGLVLVSGLAATAVSLGIMGGPPSRLQTKPPAAAPAQPKPPVVATVPIVAAAPTPTAVAPAPPAPTPEPVLAAPVAEATPIVAPTPVVVSPVVSGDPVAAGDALREARDLTGAAAQYQAALAADPDDHHAMEGMARVHLARGEARLALPFAEAIVKRRPKRESYRALLEEAQRALSR